MLMQIFIPNGSIPTFVWEPQEAFSPAPQKFQCCIFNIKKLLKKVKKILRKPEKAQIFVWEPIKDFKILT
jgi:hypothetical protein